MGALNHAGQDPSRRPFTTDLDKYYTIAFGGDRRLVNRLRLWLLDSDFRVVACFRFSQASRRLFSQSRLFGLLPMLVAALWRRRLATVHHVKIHNRARIGPGFFLMHHNGIFIGPVTIGDNCVLHHNVTIGQRIAAGDNGVPTLGNDVWIGPGATISGAITIGDGVTISAGSVVSRSIPDGALVAGNPGRVIQAGYDNSAMLNYRVARPTPAAPPETSTPVPLAQPSGASA